MLRVVSDIPLGRLPACLVVVVISGAAAACVTTSIDTQSEFREQQNAAFVWQGFRHSWSYNHRLNRIGDYVTVPWCAGAGAGADESAPEKLRNSCRARHVHTGASGTGKDTLRYSSYFATVHAPEVRFAQGRVRMRLQGREQHPLERTVTVGFEPSEGLRDVEKYAAVLNGFDLYVNADAKSKKLKRLQVQIARQPIYDASQERVELDLRVAAAFNCDTFECRRQKNQVDYTLEVQVLVAGADRGMRMTEKRFEHVYEWTKRRPVQLDALPLSGKTHVIDGRDGVYPAAALGVTGFDVDVRRPGRYGDHWFVDWMSTVRPGDYDPETGRYRFDLELMFKPWNRKTKKRVVSMAHAGNARLAMSVGMFQFADATVEHRQTAGSLFWPGKNRPATDWAATRVEPLEFSF